MKTTISGLQEEQTMNNEVLETTENVVEETEMNNEVLEEVAIEEEKEEK